MSQILRQDRHAGRVFPSYRYHRTLEPVVVCSPEHDEALGDEWADTPAAFFNSPEPSIEEAEVDPVLQKRRDNMAKARAARKIKQKG